jgi:hypothetical protein
VGLSFRTGRLYWHTDAYARKHTPPVTGHDVIEAISSVNSLQYSLLATDALLADAAVQHIGSDGHFEVALDDADISDALGEAACGCGD